MESWKEEKLDLAFLGDQCFSYFIQHGITWWEEERDLFSSSKVGPGSLHL